jgi:hypothetical protein
MTKVQIQSAIEIDLEAVLDGLQSLDSGELEQFADRVIHLRAQRRSPNLSHRESRLLQTINHGVADKVRQRYRLLNAKLHQEAISPDEHTEMLRLIDEIEAADAERIQALQELAQLRQTTVDELMDQMALRSINYYPIL